MTALFYQVDKERDTYVLYGYVYVLEWFSIKSFKEFICSGDEEYCEGIKTKLMTTKYSRVDPLDAPISS